MSEFKNYPKRPEKDEPYPVCDCGHYRHHHEDIDDATKHGFEYTKKGLGEMFEELHDWHELNGDKCERCECPKYNFKQKMKFSEWYDLGLNK